ncbi:sulfatase [Kordia antarctica]|uniref:sulfatase n=1 Tax=Kordia antarctica TaxID=1218801 RepID=UPI00293B8DDD|nr:sulfatase [Kordia antarctica]
MFIAIDDLRPEIGAYGSKIAITPNLDKFASQGLQFNNAYCQQAICGPSRASVLTGIRPETSGVFHNYIKFREVNPKVITLPQHFMQHGYETVYTGKIFHHGDLDEQSWSRLAAIDSMTSKGIKNPVGFALKKNNQERAETRKEMVAKYGKVAKYGLASGIAYEAADVSDDTYKDGYNTTLAIATMNDLLAKNNQKPFFLGVGYNKPHLNWVAPKKYWDLYDRNDIALALQKEAPQNGATMGLHPSFELRVRSGIPKKGDIDEELAITLKHAYLACVSYVDAQVGKMIRGLEEAGIRDNTIIIIWSDHGFHLGEMGIWGKATNYEIATRVPLLIWTPNMPKGSRGKTTDALVELVDIYPTLSDFAGIETPAHVEGTSFKPLIDNPKVTWKTAAFSQFPTPALREWGAFPLRPAMRETYFGPLLKDVEKRIKKQLGEKWDRELFENNLMGYAMRTEQYRLIVWKDRANPEKEPVFIEVYDHKNDALESINIAENSPELVAQLMKQFNKGWKGNLPSK